VSGGNAKGALATAAYRIFDMGALGFDLRGGLFFHQLKYAAVVENIGCPDMPSVPAALRDAENPLRRPPGLRPRGEVRAGLDAAAASSA
jgi:hypothetical protein